MRPQLPPSALLPAFLLITAPLAPRAHAQTCETRLLSQQPTIASSFAETLAMDQGTLAVGVPGRNSNAGVVELFTLGMGSWAPLTVLDPANTTLGDRLGSAVDLRFDRLIAGAPGSPTGSSPGSARVFERSGGSWTLVDTLVGSDSLPGDRFGAAVAIDGSWALVGAPEEDSTGTNSGAVYVFQRSGSGWIEVDKIIASDSLAGARYGQDVALRGDVAIVGAPADNGGAIGSGSAYVLRLSGGSWSEEQKLTSSTASVADFFGEAVFIEGDLAVIGAPFDDPQGSQSGAAFVFEYASASGWTEQQVLVPSTGDAGDRFGESVHHDLKHIAVGAPFDEDGGAGFVFEDTVNGWVEARVASSVARTSVGRAGGDVALQGDVLAVADANDNTSGFGGGAAFLFRVGGTDLNGNGIPDECETPTTVSCGPAVNNSTGGSGTITVLASLAPEDHLVDLVASGLPSFQFGYFLASQTSALVMGPGGSQGNLCLGGTIGRFTAQVGNTSGTGSFRVAVDTRALPSPLPMTFGAGQTWYFQAWYRDVNPSATSNFTDAVALGFL